MNAWELARPEDISNMTTIITNIFVFVDTMWPYNYIAEYISYVIQRLNINPQASSVTLLAASDGSVIVNTTHYLSEFYEQWNTTTHAMHAPGFSIPIILSTARDLAETVMDEERNSSQLGGQSMIALVVPSPVAFISDLDYRYAIRFMDYLNGSIPDLQFIYYAGGAVIRFNDFVSNPREDLHPLDFNTPVRESSAPVVERIRRVPRRLVNPKCGGDWSTSSSGGPNEMIQYARLGTINFYRMSPQYFYPRMSMRYLKIHPISLITFTVCTSRSVVLPHRVGTATPAGQSCFQTTPTSDFSYDLTDACDGYETIKECPPLYVSVQAQSFADPTQVSCDGLECQTPDQSQYLMFVNNLSCRNSGRLIMPHAKGIVVMALAVLSLLKLIHG